MKNNIKQKAEYCLNCKNPQCRIGCPLGNNIPAFIQKVKEDNLEELDLDTEHSIVTSPPLSPGIVDVHFIKNVLNRLLLKNMRILSILVF